MANLVANLTTRIVLLILLFSKMHRCVHLKLWLLILQCFAKWAESKRGEQVTCVYCRTPWHNAAAAGGRSGSGNTGVYLAECV